MRVGSSASATDSVFALFFEAGGLAATGRKPSRALVPQLVEAWIAWASEFIRGAPARRRAEAEAAVAVLDGLLLLRQLAGPDSADRAARRIGIRRSSRTSGAANVERNQPASPTPRSRRANDDDR